MSSLIFIGGIGLVCSIKSLFHRVTVRSKKDPSCFALFFRIFFCRKYGNILGLNEKQFHPVLVRSISSRYKMCVCVFLFSAYSFALGIW